MDSESVPRGISKKAIFQSTSDLSTSRCPGHTKWPARVLRATSRSGLMPLAATCPSDCLVGDCVAILSVCLSRSARISSSARVISMTLCRFNFGLALKYSQCILRGNVVLILGGSVRTVVLQSRRRKSVNSSDYPHY